jgi:hypothetical protein
MVDTTIELLKLATKHSQPMCIETAFSREIMHEKERQGEGPCLYSRRWVKWHITLMLLPAEAESFNKKASLCLGGVDLIS